MRTTPAIIIAAQMEYRIFNLEVISDFVRLMYDTNIIKQMICPFPKTESFFQQQLASVQDLENQCDKFTILQSRIFSYF